MKKNSVWLVLSCLMAVAMVVTSCAPAAQPEEQTGQEVKGKVTEEQSDGTSTGQATEQDKEEQEAVDEGAETIEWHLTKLDGTPVTKEIEKPEYGGTIKLGYERITSNPQDPIITNPWIADVVYDKPIMFDWDRGPAGTGENPYSVPDITSNFAYGVLTDSWSIPDPLTYVFHVRPGIRWQDKPPTNGREFTAEDLAYSWKRIWEGRWPRHDFVNIEETETRDSDGDGQDDTVVIHSNRPVANWLYEFGHVWYNFIVPRESVEAGMEDYKNVAGTGAYIWTDYIPDTLAQFERNPNYFGTWTVEDEEFQLPFADEVDIVVMPQEATRLAALRTGKVDIVAGIAKKDWPTLDKENLQSADYQSYAATMFFAMDHPPMDNLQVRRALNMAINRQEMIDSYFQGAAGMVGFPMSPGLPDLYMTVDQMPETVQEYYRYNPEKAEQLLDEAGYPRDPESGTRFSLNVIIPANAMTNAEVSEIVASYWDEVGVELTLEPLESAALTPRVFNGPYDVVFDWWANPRLTALNDFKVGNQWNRSKMTDPIFNDMWDDVMTELDSDKFISKMRDAIAYWLEQAPGFMGPSPTRRVYYQPWIKNYNGERYLSFNNSGRIWYYTWVDQALKEELGK